MQYVAKTNILGKRLPLALDDDHSQIIYSNAVSIDPEVKLTIAIPTFQRPGLLAEALESCKKQSHRGFRVIVIDNDSTPEIAVLVDQAVRNASLPNVTLFRNTKNLGMFGNWNKCFTLAETPYVSILNDDDLLAPDYVRCILEMLSLRPNADILQTGFAVVDRRLDGGVLEIDEWRGLDLGAQAEIRPIHFKNCVISNNRMGCLAITYRKKMAVERGGFDPLEYPTADYFFNARMLANGAYGYEVNRSLAIYRIAENESMKSSTLIGFIANDYLLRCEAAAFFVLPFLIRLYAFLSVSTHRKVTQRYWSCELDERVIEQKIGIRPTSSTVMLTIYRVYVALIRRLIRVLDR